LGKGGIEEPSGGTKKEGKGRGGGGGGGKLRLSIPGRNQRGKIDRWFLLGIERGKGKKSKEMPGGRPSSAIGRKKGGESRIQRPQKKKKEFSRSHLHEVAEEKNVGTGGRKVA